jgi:catechol-2,3-dioxygenase
VSGGEFGTQGRVEMKLGMILIFVSDLEEAKRFYRDILGFPIKSQQPDRVEFVHDGCDFMAFKCEKDATVEDYSRAARSVFVFEVASDRLITARTARQRCEISTSRTSRE